MTIPVSRRPYDRIAVLEDELLLVNEERIRQAGFIAQFIATRDLQRLCEGPHSVFDTQRCTASENATDDLIDRIRGVVDWPPLPSSILTNGGNP